MGSHVSSELKDALPTTSTYEVAVKATTFALQCRSDACCIAINNTTEYTLKNPSFFAMGSLEPPPDVIPSEFAGYILAQTDQSWSSDYGTNGVISYDINTADGRDKKLQILWYIPEMISNSFIFSSCCAANIRIGPEIADEDLYKKMYHTKKGEYGYWWNTNSTPNNIFNLDQTFEAEVFMKNTRQTPLIIELRKRR